MEQRSPLTLLSLVMTFFDLTIVGSAYGIVSGWKRRQDPDNRVMQRSSKLSSIPVWGDRCFDVVCL